MNDFEAKSDEWWFEYENGSATVWWKNKPVLKVDKSSDHSAALETAIAVFESAVNRLKQVNEENKK